MKAFIDEHHDAAETGAFLDKTFTAMATGAYDHAGHEHVVDQLNTAAAVWGCVLVPPSGADAAINHQNGNPWGLSFGLRHGRIADHESASAVLQAHLRRFAAVTEVMAAARDSGLSPGRHPRRRVSSHPPTQPNREGGSMHTPNNPLRATQIFTGPGSRPGNHSSSRGGSGLGSTSSGPHSPSNPLRATQVFTGPSSSGGTGAGAGSPGSSSSSGSSRSQSSSGGGHSPTNPLRASDVFGSPRKDR